MVDDSQVTRSALVRQVRCKTSCSRIGGGRVAIRRFSQLSRFPNLSGRNWRGAFEPLKDPSYFARVEVDAEAGTISWPGGLDMAPEPLYAEASRHPGTGYTRSQLG